MIVERERESQRLPAIDQLIQDGVIQAQRNGKGTFIGCSPTLLASDYKQVPLVLERVSLLIIRGLTSLNLVYPEAKPENDFLIP